MAALSLTLFSALLYAALFAPFGASYLGWVALAPFFYAIAGARPLRAAALGGVFALGMTALVIAWVVPTARDYFGVSTAAALAFLLLVCLITTVPYYAAGAGLLAALRPRIGDTAWWLLVPAAWVATEYARSELGLRSSWCLLGDAWFASGDLRQIADLLGVYGVGAVVALVNAAIAAAMGAVIHRKRGIGVPLRVAAIATAAVVAAIGYGSWRTRAAGDPAADRGSALRVALVQGNVPQSLRWNRVHASHVLRTYGTLTRSAVGAGESTDLVVWPESALQTELADPGYGPPLRALVERVGVPLLAGIPRSEADRHYNSALFLVPGGEAMHYDKVRLLPFVETEPEYTAGRDVGVFRVGAREIGVLICLEAIDPGIARATVRAGADALFNLSNDGWYGDTAGVVQHFSKVVFRAIENRVPVVRATATGITAVIDPSGDVRDRLPENEAAVLHAAVPPAWSPSFYRSFGDVFAIACCAVFAAAIGVAIVRENA